MAAGRGRPSGGPYLRVHLLADTSGSTAIEYALIAVGISITIAGVAIVLGGEVAALFQVVVDALAGLL